MNTTAKYRTDAHGFPVDTCTRCDGTGNLPEFSHVIGGRCLGCNGSGTRYPAGTVATLALQWFTALNIARQTGTPADDAVRVDLVGRAVAAYERLLARRAAGAPTTARARRIAARIAEVTAREATVAARFPDLAAQSAAGDHTTIARAVFQTATTEDALWNGRGGAYADWAEYVAENFKPAGTALPDWMQ